MVKDEQCRNLDLGLSYSEEGNCCFVDDDPEGWLPQPRAVPCDNLDYIPIEEKLVRTSFEEKEIDLNWSELLIFEE